MRLLLFGFRFLVFSALALCWVAVGFFVAWVAWSIIGGDFESFLGIPAGPLFLVVGSATLLTGLRLLSFPLRKIVRGIRVVRDAYAPPATITGKIVRMRQDHHLDDHLSDGEVTCYVRVGEEEFEVHDRDFATVVEGQEVTVTYRPNTRVADRISIIQPPWLTPTVIGLAQGIRDEKALDRLPILADAMEEAGCADADLLKRLRDRGDEGQLLVERILRQVLDAPGFDRMPGSAHGEARSQTRE